MSLFLVAMIVLAMQTPAVETIASDTMSGIDTPRQAVARNDQQWAALWQQHAGLGKPAPAVDFSRRMAVAVFLGSRPSAGYRVEVSGTRQEGKTLIVTWREVPPDRDSLLAQVLTSPAHLVSIPRFDGEVKFERVPAK
jgi:hypothetical protein